MLRGAAKFIFLFLIAVPLSPLPHSSLMAIGTSAVDKKKSKKSSVYLNYRPFTQPPPLYIDTAIKKKKKKKSFKTASLSNETYWTMYINV